MASFEDLAFLFRFHIDVWLILQSCSLLFDVFCAYVWWRDILECPPKMLKQGLHHVGWFPDNMLPKLSLFALTHSEESVIRPPFNHHAHKASPVPQELCCLCKSPYHFLFLFADCNKQQTAEVKLQRQNHACAAQSKWMSFLVFITVLLALILNSGV